MSDHRLASSAAVAGHGAKDGKGFAQRAQRFAVETSIRYREAGTANWQETTTVNISASGILFRAVQPLPPRATLDITLALPVAISGEAPAEIRCRGTVVRKASDFGRQDTPVLAVSIARYRFVHKQWDSSDGEPKQATS